MDTLKHLQSVILDIMKDIDKLCVKHGIEYYLLGGSAIGAIRHKGFIPWDDDLDIIMTDENYIRFIKVCKSELDERKYAMQEGLVDWPLNFSKIRLKGTELIEHEAYKTSENISNGIYVDVFKLDNAPSGRLARRWQYLCAKFHLSYLMSERTYSSATWQKKALMSLSRALAFRPLRKFVTGQVTKYNGKNTGCLAFLYGRTRFSTSFTEKAIYGKPLRVPFEDTFLPVPEHYHEYLTQMFGDYMKLPPAEQQKGLHLISVDFGKY